MNVARAETVLVAVLDEALAGVDHEDAFAGLRLRLIDHHDAGGDAGAVKEVGGQTDDGLEVALADEIFADGGLGIAAEEDAVRQNAGPPAGRFERSQDMQQIGVVALLLGRHAVVLEALVGVVLHQHPAAPALVAEGRIGHHVVEGPQHRPFQKLRRGQGVALHDLRFGVTVQDHVHPRQTRGGRVLLLPEEAERGAGLVRHLQQQGAGAAGRVINGRLAAGFGFGDAEHLRHDARDLGRGVELALALAALGGEVAHEVLVSVAKDVIALGAVAGEVEGRILENGDQVGQPVSHVATRAELVRVIEVGEIGERELGVGSDEGRDDLLVDLVADILGALQAAHGSSNPAAFRDDDRREGLARVFIADVFQEEKDQYVVLILAGIHAAPQFVATRPQRRVKFGFLNGHALRQLVGEARQSLALMPPGAINKFFAACSELALLELQISFFT